MRMYLPVVTLAFCAACSPIGNPPQQDAGNNCAGGAHRNDAGVCTTATTPAEDCGDGNDNDGDDKVDCLDADCATDARCNADGGVVVDQDGGVCVPTETVGEVSCGDGQDGDCDGLTDLDDPNCFNAGDCQADPDKDQIPTCLDTAPECYNRSQMGVVVCTVPPAPAATPDAGQMDAAAVTLPCEQQVYHLNMGPCTESDGGFSVQMADGGTNTLRNGGGVVVTRAADGTCTSHANGNLDSDGDGEQNCRDSCVFQANPRPTCSNNAGCVNAGGVCSNGCTQQRDIDADGVGDICDPRQGEPDARPTGNDTDADGDGLYGASDPCPNVSNTGVESFLLEDPDGDGIPTLCDEDPFTRPDGGTPDAGPSQRCVPGNSVDTDCDGVSNAADNCPVDYNPPPLCGALRPACQGEGAVCSNGRCSKQNPENGANRVCNAVAGSCDPRLLTFPTVSPEHANDGGVIIDPAYGTVINNGTECAGNTGALRISSPGAINQYALEMDTVLDNGVQSYPCVQAWANFSPEQIPAGSEVTVMFWGRAEDSRNIRLGFLTGEHPYVSLTPTLQNGYQEFSLRRTWGGYPTPPGVAPEGCQSEFCVVLLVNEDNTSTRRLTFQVGNSSKDVFLDAVQVWVRRSSCPN